MCKGLVEPIMVEDMLKGSSAEGAVVIKARRSMWKACVGPFGGSVCKVQVLLAGRRMLGDNIMQASWLGLLNET